MPDQLKASEVNSKTDPSVANSHYPNRTQTNLPYNNMSYSENTDAMFGKDYTYREARYLATGVKLVAYEHEMYDGHDEADPFRVETACEMREKAQNNDLLPEGYLRTRAEVVLDSTGPDEIKLARSAVDAAASEDTYRGVSPAKLRDGRYVPPHRRTRGANVHARKLDLHAVLTDAAIQRKYKFLPLDLAELRAVREENPTMAAEMAQEMLEGRGFAKTLVVSGTTAQYTKSEAERELAYLAATEGVKSCLVDAKISSTSIAGDKIHFLSDTAMKDCNYSHEWELICPIARAKAGLDYFKLLIALGYDECYSRAGIPAAVLGISVVHNAEIQQLHHPTVEYHAATPTDAPFDYHGLQHHADVPSGVRQLLGAIRPVLQGQSHVAYSLAIPGPGGLLNEHVRVKGVSCKFAGKELRKFQTFRLAGELWFFYDTSEVAKSPADRQVARTRPPVKGEAVRLLVPGPAGPTAYYSSPVGVIGPGLDNAWCVDSQGVAYAQHGMSGLPIVAESDGAVVAIHDGIVMGNLRVLPIPRNLACDVIVEQAVSRRISYTCPGAKTIAHVDLDALKVRKSHRNNLTAINDALDNDGSRTLWSCYGARCYVGGSSGELKVPGYDIGFTTTGAPGRVSELPLRAPSQADRVVIIGRNTHGTYCTPVVPMGEVIGDSLFAIDLGGDMGVTSPDFFNGAAVVALDDANIVGFVSAKGISRFGSAMYTLMCWACKDIPQATEVSQPMSRTQTSETASSGMFTFASASRPSVCGPGSLSEARRILAEVLPEAGFLDEELFPDSDLDEVCSHPSLNSYAIVTDKPFAANRYWARMGDSAMSFLIMREMRTSRVADTEATIRKSAIQNNARQSETMLTLGLDKLYFFRTGSNLSQHNLADLLEAILGWVVERTGLLSEQAKYVYETFHMGLG